MGGGGEGNIQEHDIHCWPGTNRLKLLGQMVN